VTFPAGAANIAMKQQLEAKQTNKQLKVYEENLSLEAKAREGMQKKFG
jgi:hypothetical protein